MTIVNGLKILLLFTTAFVGSLVFIPLIIRISEKLNLFDKPDSGEEGRKVHTRPIPRLGGVAMVGSYLLSLLLWAQPAPYWGILFPGVLLFAIGFLDDLRPLPATIRFIIQILAASIAILSSNLVLKNVVLTFGVSIPLPYWVGFAISLFIIVGAINSINMIDGMDGLAGGIILIGISLLGYIHYIIFHDLELIALYNLPIAAVILGFLRYNTHPASIFMGDGGSNWLGFMAGVLILVELNGINAIHLKTGISQFPDSPAQIQLVSVVLTFAVPIFDTAFVIIRRLTKGQHPFQPDKNHFHHGLLRLGLGQPQSVTFIYFVALTTGVIGLFPVLFSKITLSWVPYVSAMIVIVFIPLIARIDESSLSKIRGIQDSFKKLPKFYVSLKWFFHNWERVNRYTIYIILFATPFIAGVAPKTIGYAALIMLLILLVFMLLPASREDFLDSLTIAIGATVVLISNNLNPIWIMLQGEKYNVQFLYNYAFLFLLISTVLYILLTINVSDLIITPTDFLMIMLPLLLLLAPEPFQTDYNLRTIGLRSLILFIGLRTIIRREHQFMYRIRLVTFAALFYVMLTGVLGFRFVH